MDIRTGKEAASVGCTTCQKLQKLVQGPYAGVLYSVGTLQTVPTVS